jgi:hypothetical protein
MTYQELNLKSKDFTLAMIDANKQAAHATIEAIKGFVGKDFATYTYGLTYVADEIANNARKIVENFSGLANAGDKK